MAKKLVALDGTPVLFQEKEIFTCDYVGVIKEVNLDKRSMVITGTDETKDRDGDIIRMSGWVLENYKKNPVFLWSHNYGSVPIARAEKVIKRREPNRMDFHLLWPTKGIYPFADMILELYGEKIINASSVGFIPFKWEPLSEEDKQGDDNPRNQYGRVYVKQELLELSGCAVPSNPNALQNALKGFTETRKSEFSLESLFKWISGGTVIPIPEKADDVFEEIKKSKTEILDETAPIQVQVPDKVVPSQTDSTSTPPDEEVEITEKDIEEILKPYPNEHACRLNPPGKYDKFARKNCFKKHDGKCIDFIFGIKEGKSEVQALRYKKEVWTADAARSHCSSSKGSFEAASSSEVSPEETKILVDEGTIKEIRSKLDEISQTIKSMAESDKGTRTGHENDKGPMGPQEKKDGAASAILDKAFLDKKPQVSKDGLKELIEAVRDLKQSLGK